MQHLWFQLQPLQSCVKKLQSQPPPAQLQNTFTKYTKPPVNGQQRGAKTAAM